MPHTIKDVALRCRDCSHEWRYEMPVATDPLYDSTLRPVVKPTDSTG